jgi:hypothetical protein
LIEIELCAEGEDLPDVKPKMSTVLDSGVHFAYTMPAADEPEQEVQVEEPSESLADMMAKLKSL